MRRLVMILLLLSGLAIAQEKTFTFYGGANLGFSGNFGLANPLTSIRAGGELSSSKWLLIGGGSFSPTHKLDTGDGYGLSFRPEVYRKHTCNQNRQGLPRESGIWLYGIGATFSCAVTSQYTKCSERPTIGGGYDMTDQWRLRAVYMIPTENRNHVQGPIVNADILLAKVRKLPIYLTWQVQVFHLHATDNPTDKRWGTSASFGLKLNLFRKKF